MKTRLLLFFSSYAPLFFLLAVQFRPWALITSSFLLGVIGVGSLILILKLNSRTAPAPLTFVSVQDAGPEAAAYLSSYLLPFIAVDEPTWRQLIVYVGFFTVAATIHVRSSVVQINPLLYVIGYRVVQTTDKYSSRRYIVTRGKVAVGEAICCTRLGNDVWIQRACSQPA